MTKAKINGVEYEARDYLPFVNEGGLDVVFYIYTNSIDSIIEAVGEKATIEIENEFVANDMKIERACMYWDNGREACEIRFTPFNISQTVQNNSDAISMHEDALLELAELIG